MPITRNGPVMNMDTDTPLIMRQPNQRFTRSTAHRILKAAGIKHDAGGAMEYLLYLIQMNNLQYTPPPPGPILKPVKQATEEFKEEMKKEGKILDLAPDGYPVRVFTLRKLCKERKILFKMTDKRIELIQKLENHKHGQNAA